MKLILLFMFLFPKWSVALPLVAENAAINLSEYLTLFPDHQDSKKFYYIPNSSRVPFNSDNTLPLFSYTFWGLNQVNPSEEAGAFMTFVLKVHSDQQQTKAIKEYKEKNPHHNIALMPIKESLIILKNDEGESPFKTLFKEANFNKKSGLIEHEIGFNTILTPLGAKILKTHITNPLVFNLDYCYKFIGLGPTMDANIYVNWSRVYDHYRISSSYTRGWFSRVTVSKEVEKLRQKNFVRWEINGGDATDNEYVKEITNAIIERLFKPELSMTPSGNTSNNGWQAFNFSYATVHREELKEEEWRITKRELVEREMCNGISLKEISPYLDQIIKDADA
jgi:hypothetical protein